MRKGLILAAAVLFMAWPVEAADSVEQAVADSLNEYGSDAKLAVIPKGPYVLASVAKDEA